MQQGGQQLLPAVASLLLQLCYQQDPAQQAQASESGSAALSLRAPQHALAAAPGSMAASGEGWQQPAAAARFLQHAQPERAAADAAGMPAAGMPSATANTGVGSEACLSERKRARKA
jgi:hypothetical protein